VRDHSVSEETYFAYWGVEKDRIRPTIERDITKTYAYIVRKTAPRSAFGTGRCPVPESFNKPMNGRQDGGAARHRTAAVILLPFPQPFRNIFRNRCRHRRSCSRCKSRLPPTAAACGIPQTRIIALEFRSKRVFPKASWRDLPESQHFENFVLNAVIPKNVTFFILYIKQFIEKTQ